MAIHKCLDEDSKVINFARGLGNKYKTLRTVMLCKAPYPTFNQFVNALRGFKMREDGDDEASLDPAMALVTQKWWLLSLTMRSKRRRSIIQSETI